MTDFRMLPMKERLQFLYENKTVIMTEKKSAMKYGDAISYIEVITPDHSDFAAKSSVVDKQETDSVLKRNLVINTTNYMDGHDDVHFPGIWNKTLKEAHRVLLLDSHKRGFQDVISDDVKAVARKMNWTDLGLPMEGVTQALIFQTTLSKERHPFMFDQYAKGYVQQHSVGMQYVTLFLCVNSEEKYLEEEKAAWDKYYPQIINKDRADERGYFWAVTEAKLIEGSAVLFGSNPITPTLSTKEEISQPESTLSEPESTDKPTEEPLKSTPSESELVINKLKSIFL